MEGAQIAVVQASFIVGNPIINLDKVVKLAHETKKRYPLVKCLVFPELTVTGYDVSHSILEFADDRYGQYFQFVSLLSKKLEMYIVYGYVEKGDMDEYYNSIQIINPDGCSIANYRKIHLTEFERDIFTPGNEICVVQTSFGKVGLMICWDLAFPELARTLVLQGANILIAPVAWEKPYQDPFHIFSAARAMENTVYLVTCNHIMKSSEFEFFGESAIYAPDGKRISYAEKDGETILTASISRKCLEKVRNNFYTMLKERRSDVY